MSVANCSQSSGTKKFGRGTNNRVVGVDRGTIQLTIVPSHDWCKSFGEIYGDVARSIFEDMLNEIFQ